MLKFNESLRLQKKFNDLIPGGSHTYAKGDDQFPEFMAPYIAKGKGSRIWDVDGNEYLEYGNGLRSVSLGHAVEPIISAAYKQMQLGTNFGRPARIELECAEELLSIIDGADMVKFCKNGSDATDGAIRLARAFTGRDKIGVCACHPFFSVSNWFIGTTPMASGVPQVEKNLSLTFHYNDLGSAEKLFEENPGEIACVILEAQKYDEPQDGFLHKLKDLCHRHGALFILDELITGFRWDLGGAQKKFDIIPDLTAWGKALGNGFAIAALTGKREIMELGGLTHKKERVFLLSTTHGAETHALAAAIATIKFYKENNVIERFYEQGAKLRQGLMRASADLGLEDSFTILGPGCCLVYTTRDREGQPSQPLRSLFLQETIKRGLIMPSLITCYSHTDADIEETCEKVHQALITYKKALNEGTDKHLQGRSIQPVWRKYNYA